MNIKYFIKNWRTIDKKDINFSEEEWREISCYQKLSEGFMREFKDKVDWINISIYQKLSEEFIREFRNRVDWGYISIDQKLSEGFMREFKDKVIWYYISKYQTLSTKLIDEFIFFMCYEESFRNIYKERFYQYTNSYIYTINKRASCCLGYQWDNDIKFIQLSNSTLPIIFSKVL